uniref:IF rod domain-containing protein n=1 Tax=Eptatretus burgeri TaxID=7764 RepID=A0A8C4PYR6_EPTBU
MIHTFVQFLIRCLQQELARVGIKLNTNDSSAIEVDNRSVDLAAILCQIRGEYNAISDKNTEEAEEYYKTQMQRFELESREAAAVVTTTNTETIEITKTVQEMQMQLQGLQMRHSSLQQMLMELEGQFQNQISSLQSQVMEHESSMEHHRAELQRQLVDFRTLMDIKIALDQEIATYRKILEGVSLNVTEMDMGFGGCAQTSTTTQFSTSSTGGSGQVQTGHHSQSSSAGSQSSMSQHSGCSTGGVMQTISTTTKEITTERVEPLITKKVTMQAYGMQGGNIISDASRTSYSTHQFNN